MPSRGATLAELVALRDGTMPVGTPEPEARRTPAKARKTARKAPAKKSTKKAPAEKPEVAPDRAAIGSNPERRFASASSRNLHRKS